MYFKKVFEQQPQIYPHLAHVLLSIRPIDPSNSHRRVDVGFSATMLDALRKTRKCDPFNAGTPQTADAPVRYRNQGALRRGLQCIYEPVV